jgi:acyl-CoA thioesterase I
MMKTLIILFIAVITIGCSAENNIIQEEHIEQEVKEMPKKEWRFVPIGDSYTKGEGTIYENSWPSVLVRNLRDDWVNITLVTNPAENGWTTLEALELEMPEFKMGRPNVATLMIGANDVVQKVPLDTFEERFSLLLDLMIKVLPDKKNLVVITIPDFSITPVGKAYTGEENIEEEIMKYNHIIVKEAKKRNLTVVDLFEPSKIMEENPSLISEDGLHPSAEGYREWERIIRPSFSAMIYK